MPATLTPRARSVELFIPSITAGILIPSFLTQLEATSVRSSKLCGVRKITLSRMLLAFCQTSLEWAS